MDNFESVKDKVDAVQESVAFAPSEAPFGGAPGVGGGGLGDEGAAWGHDGEATVRGRAAPASPLKTSPKRSVATVQCLDDTVMRYQSLRLGACSSDGRGHLMVAERFEEYREVRGLSITTGEAERILGTAIFEAQAVDSAPPPSGHRFPRAQEGFDYRYTAVNPMDLASDGDFHSVTLTRLEIKPELEYLCVPRMSPLVFRAARITNPSLSALPEGPADISVDGEFLHTTPLRDVIPNGVFRLGLGVDMNVKVSRNASFDERTSGLMGGTTEVAHTLVIEAVNHRPHSITLEIQERLPEPSAEHKDDLKVVVGKVTPAWSAFIPEENPLLKSAYRWRLTVASGGRVEARANYSLEMGSKLEVQGGNRREQNS